MAVYKDKKTGRYYFSFKLDGVRYLKRKYNNKPFTTKAEAKMAEAQFKQQLEYSKRLVITLYVLFDEFIENTKCSLKTSTLANYKKFKENYLILMPNKPIHELKLNDIASFYKAIKKTDLSIAYKNRQIGTMINLLKYGNVAYNLSANLQLPLLEPIKENQIKDFKSKTKYLPLNLFELLIAPLSDFSGNNLYYYTLLSIIYFTGLRIGEISALTINDYNDSYLLINKDYIRVNNQDVIQPPKSNNSIRKVKLDKTTDELLQLYIKEYKPDNVLFRLEGKYLNQQKLRRIIATLAKYDAVFDDYEITPHTLRHSHASMLRELGYDEYLIAQRLGNTPSVAASTYIHTNNNEADVIAQSLDKIKSR